MSPPRVSTRRWRRLPWAALATLALLLIIDQTIFDEQSALWGRYREEARSWPPAATGVVKSRTTIRQLAEAGPEASTVVVLGNSRAAAGVRTRLVERDDPRWTVRSHAHAGFELVESLHAVEILRPMDVDVGVLMLSEFDVFRMPRPRPQFGVCSWKALGSVARWLGPRTLLEQRRGILRLAACSTLDAYASRAALQQMLPESLSRLDLSIVAVDPDAARVPVPQPARQTYFTSVELTKAERKAIIAARKQLLADARAAFPQIPRGAMWRQVQHALNLERGPHVAFNRRVVEGIIEVFLDEGNRVLLVEPPLNPLVRRVLDPSLRRDFVAYAHGLAQRDGVDFLPLTESGPFTGDHFSDLTHLHNLRGAPQMSAAVAERLRPLPDPDDSR